MLIVTDGQGEGGIVLQDEDGQTGGSTVGIARHRLSGCEDLAATDAVTIRTISLLEIVPESLADGRGST
jgi:hypothetical protein